MDPIKVDFSGRGGEGKKTIIIPPERAALKVVISILLSVVSGAVAYYFMLPPINLKAAEFYYFIGLVILSFVFFLAVLSSAVHKPEYMTYVKSKAKVPIVLVLVLAVVAGVGYVAGSQLFRAKKYSQIMHVDTQSTFSVEEPDFNTVPKLDESASANLANRALSNLADLGYVSQFTVFPSYPQINYQGAPVRVASLQYANIIKWLTNKDKGFPGYIIINVSKESTEFVTLENSIKYSLADHFGRHVKRVIRFEYPGYIFSTPSFEIDESGNPYWICARINKTIGLFGGRDVMGAVLVDAVTGKCTYYDIGTISGDDSFAWIDRIYNADLIIEQFNFYGKYQKGFWNSLLGQTGCVETTDGYNYLAINDDVWLYTGVTSVTSDQSITGFVLVNQRTKETVFYGVNGAKETTAKTSAEGLVQQYEYIATFPLLLNIGGEPTYFMSLKDASDIVQMYAMINVKQYNKIKAVGDTLPNCIAAYIESLEKEGLSVGDNIEIPDDDDNGENKTDDSPTVLDGVVTEIRSAVIGGNTTFYIKLSGAADRFYSISASSCADAVILNPGDKAALEFMPSDAPIVPLKSLKILAADAPSTAAPSTDNETTTAAQQPSPLP